VTFQLVVILHVLSAMTWFGSGLSLPRRLRTGLARGRPAASEAAEDVMRGARLIGIAALCTVVTGFALIFLGGGFAVFARRIHIGLTLALVALALTWFGVRPAWARVARIAAGTEPLEGATPFVKRGAMLHGITHALLVVTLALMLWHVQ